MPLPLPPQGLFLYNVPVIKWIKLLLLINCHLQSYALNVLMLILLMSAAFVVTLIINYFNY